MLFRLHADAIHKQAFALPNRHSTFQIRAVQQANGGLASFGCEDRRQPSKPVLYVRSIFFFASSTLVFEQLERVAFLLPHPRL